MSNRKSLSELLTGDPQQRWVNLLTLFRFVAFPVLLVLLFLDRIDIFKWLLLASFITDGLDGYFARKFNVTSVLGAKLDSLGDDLTIIAAIVGVIVTQSGFLAEVAWAILVLLGLFVIQTVVALIRYGKTSSFHTYLAKISAVMQAVFMTSVFFLNDVIYPLFYIAAAFTVLDLIEEIILVLVLEEWEANVKGLYWVLQNH